MQDTLELCHMLRMDYCFITSELFSSKKCTQFSISLPNVLSNRLYSVMGSMSFAFFVHG